MRKALLVTAADAERTTVVESLEGEFQIQTEIFKKHGHYAERFCLGSNSGGEWEVTLAQPTDKRALATQALLNSFLSDPEPPTLVIMVGMCCGFPERGVSMADVILARYVYSYQHRRHRDGTVVISPDPYRTDATLMDFARTIVTRPAMSKEKLGFKIRIKDFASSEDLIDDASSDLRLNILKQSGDDIVGYEMEGHGYYHALLEANREGHRTTGLLIKGVSDFGDGEMREDKAQKQKTATRNALVLALELLKRYID